MALDYSADYNNRAHVTEFPQIVAKWQQDGAAFTRAMAEQGRAELDIRYGTTDRQYIDLYKGAGDGPLAMFIHGGYWRALSPKEHSHFARGLTERGVNVAVAGYDLAPQVSIAQIVEQMRAAILFLWKRFGKRITVYGHSAGGHLTACMLATDWKALDPTAPSDLVAVGSAISGVFDLTRLVHTDMNADFKLDEKSAHEGSPLFWPAPKGRVHGCHRRRERSCRNSCGCPRSWRRPGARPASRPVTRRCRASTISMSWTASPIRTAP